MSNWRGEYQSLINELSVLYPVYNWGPLRTCLGLNLGSGAVCRYPDWNMDIRILLINYLSFFFLCVSGILPVLYLCVKMNRVHLVLPVLFRSEEREGSKPVACAICGFLGTASCAAGT